MKTCQCINWHFTIFPSTGATDYERRLTKLKFTAALKLWESFSLAGNVFVVRRSSSHLSFGCYTADQSCRHWYTSFNIAWPIIFRWLKNLCKRKAIISAVYYLKIIEAWYLLINNGCLYFCIDKYCILRNMIILSINSNQILVTSRKQIGLFAFSLPLQEPIDTVFWPLIIKGETFIVELRVAKIFLAKCY